MSLNLPLCQMVVNAMEKRNMIIGATNHMNEHAKLITIALIGIMQSGKEASGSTQ